MQGDGVSQGPTANPSSTGLSFNLLALLFLAHVSLPRAQAHTRRFFSLSYYNPDTGRYGVGLGDLNLVFFYIVLFTGLRAATMEYVLAPFGKLAGLSKRKDLTRFSEQMWMLMYYGVFWPLGVVRFPFLHLQILGEIMVLGRPG